MEITDIRIFPVDEPKLKAFVSVIFDRCFIVSDIKIIDGNNGYFLSMPSKKRRDGTFRDIAHPLNSETRNAMEEAVVKAYLQVMKEKGETPTETPEDSEALPEAEVEADSAEVEEHVSASIEEDILTSSTDIPEPTAGEETPDVSSEEPDAPADPGEEPPPSTSF